MLNHMERLIGLIDCDFKGEHTERNEERATEARAADINACVLLQVYYRSIQIWLIF